MQKQTIYKVGDHRFSIRCSSQGHLDELLPSFVPFVDEMKMSLREPLFDMLLLDDADVPASAPALPIADASLQASPESLSETDMAFEWEDAQCVIRFLPGDNHEIHIKPHGSDYIFLLSCQEHFSHCVTHLPADAPLHQRAFVLNNFLMMIYAFRAAEHDTLLFHASVVAYQGRGYLFLGKSGTGKSTHTNLWIKYIPGCSLLNDDNPVVRRLPSGEIIVYGSPWSGKTLCYKDEQMPVGAFVRLEQAPENRIVRETAVHAFADLLPSCSCLKRDQRIYRGVIDTVTSLSRLSHVYLLRCLPDSEAAQLCCETITDK